MSKLRHLLVYITFFCSQSIYASLTEHKYYPDSFIQNIDTYSKTEILKEELRKILSLKHLSRAGRNHDLIVSNCPVDKKCYQQSRKLNYRQARKKLFGDIDLEIDGNGKYFVEDRYCQAKYQADQGVGPGKIPNSQLINCEHTWPQSRFNTQFSKSLQKNDLHHLFGVNSRSNSARGNIIFGEVNGSVLSKNCQSSRRGTINYKNSQTKAFEPPKKHRGDVARAIFYFSVRYNLRVSAQEEFFLRRWHREDPVNLKEIKRHNKIFTIQENRNPFIDDESLVELIRDF